LEHASPASSGRAMPRHLVGAWMNLASLRHHRRLLGWCRKLASSACGHARCCGGA
jgi:hypothetical protein